MKLLINPLGDRVVIQRDDPAMGDGLIHVPDSILQAYKDLMTTGTILAVGPDVESLKVGDYVSFSNYAGMKLRGAVKHTREPLDLDIMREDDVLCTITTDDD